MVIPEPVRVEWSHRNGTIQVGGRDVSNAVTGAYIHLSADEVPEVTVEILAGALALATDGAYVEIDATTHGLLVALGWTPPGGGTRE